MSDPASESKSAAGAELAPVVAADQKNKYENENLPKPSEERVKHVINVNNNLHYNVEYIKGETRVFNTYRQTLTVEPAQVIINPPIYVDMSAKKPEAK